MARRRSDRIDAGRAMARGGTEMRLGTWGRVIVLLTLGALAGPSVRAFAQLAASDQRDPIPADEMGSNITRSPIAEGF